MSNLRRYDAVPFTLSTETATSVSLEELIGDQSSHISPSMDLTELH